MRGFILLILSTSVLISCTKEPLMDVRELTISDSLILEAHDVGWELYSWDANGELRFSLVVATTRYKTTEEILANKYAVTGREELKMLLRSLSAGDEITWYGVDWIQEHIQGTAGLFLMPSLLTQYDIDIFCRENHLELNFVE